MYKHLLFPTDGSTVSLKALDTAITMARSFDAKVTVLTVSPPYPPVYAGDGFVFDPITTKEWKAINDKHAGTVQADVKKRIAKKHGANAIPVKIQFLSIADIEPYNAIIEAAKKQKCDLIVMASHGRRGLSAILLGSETTKVLTHSKIPVLVCR